MHKSISILDKHYKCFKKNNNKKFLVIFLFLAVIFLNLLGDYNFSNGNGAIENKNCTGIIDRIEGDKIIVECSNKKVIFYFHKNLHGLKEGDCVKINNNNIKLDIKLNANRKNMIKELYSNLQVH